MYRLVILLSFVFLARCGNHEKTLKPGRKPLMEAVYATGFVVAKDEYQVFAQSEGYLAKKLAAEGTEVKAGDPLFIIESDQQAARYQIAYENYQTARKNLMPGSPVMREVTASLEAARTRMGYDSSNCVRYENLWKQNATTRADYDRARLAYDNSKSEYRLQLSRFEKVQDQLQLELANAESQLKIATDESQRYTIRSLIDGMVFTTTKAVGELVRRGEVLAVVGNKNGYYLQLNVDELDAHRVAVNQRVLVSVDAYPGKMFEARVTQVYPLVDKRQQSVHVDAELTSELPGWFSGLALEANIIIREKKDALVIPKTALYTADTVLVKTDKGNVAAPFVKGIETLEEVEVLSGLDTSSLIVIIPK